ncbi:unnamed protein product [Discosporangium mesarthrocarpum]
MAGAVKVQRHFTSPLSHLEKMEASRDVGPSMPAVSTDPLAPYGGEDVTAAETSGLPAGREAPTEREECRNPAITVARHGLTAAYKPGKLTVVLDMDECLLHSKFHGPGAASEAYRQLEERPEDVNDVNSFWVALDDGDTAQVNKRPGLDAFLEALARDYNTVVFTAAMPDYAGPVLDFIDPKGTLFHQRLYRNSCRQVKGAFLKDLSIVGAECGGDLSRIVLVDNNPLSFICQPNNGILVASFYDDPNDSALASVMQLIRHLDQAQDVRPFLKDMFRLDTLLCEYRSALFDDVSSLEDEDGKSDDEESNSAVSISADVGDAHPSLPVESASPGAVSVGEGDEEEVERAPGLHNREEEETGLEGSQGRLQQWEKSAIEAGSEGEVEAEGSRRERMVVKGGKGSSRNMCLFNKREGFACEGGRDDDDESVETEACSVESSVESLPSPEEMDVEF